MKFELEFIDENGNRLDIGNSGILVADRPFPLPEVGDEILGSTGAFRVSSRSHRYESILDDDYYQTSVQVTLQCTPVRSNQTASTEKRR